MSGSMPRPELVRWWPGALAAGFGLAGIAHLSVASFEQGGLATVALAAAGAVGIGVPLAGAEWNLREPQPTGDLRFAGAIERWWGTLWCAAAAAAAMRPLGPTAVAIAAIGWWGLTAVYPRFPAAARGAGLAAVAVAAAAAFTAGPSWTLLEPSWSSGSGWAARSVTTGVLLAGAGLGFWSGHPAAPGPRRAPWMTAGISILGLTLTAVALGGAYERAGSLPSALPVAACIAALAALATRPGAQGGREGLLGAMLFALLAYPGFSILNGWTASLALVGPACVAYRLARSGQRAMGLGFGAILSALAYLGWPGAPGTLGQALLLAAVLVVPVWVVGTATVLQDRRA
jgi:hypothetical protein